MKHDDRDIQFGRIPYHVIDAGMLDNIKPGAAKCYLVIAAHANERWRSSVGTRRIARLAGIKHGSVSRSTDQLVEAGLIRKARVGNGHGLTYEIITKTPADRSPVGGRSTPESVHPTADGSNPDRSPVGGPTVHPWEANRSPVGVHNRGTENKQKASSCSFLSSQCLTRHGIGDPVRGQLDGNRYVTDADLDRLAQQHSAGALVNKLRDLIDKRKREAETKAKQDRLDAIFRDPELLAAVQEAEPNVEHKPAFHHTRSAMCKVARERGLLPTNREPHPAGPPPILGTTEGTRIRSDV